MNTKIIFKPKKATEDFSFPPEELKYKKLAFNLLKERKTAYAVIYGIKQENKPLFFEKPLCKYSAEEVNQFINAFKVDKGKGPEFIYALYKDQQNTIEKALNKKENTSK